VIRGGFACLWVCLIWGSFVGEALGHTGALAALEIRQNGQQVLVAWSAEDFAAQGGLDAPVLTGCESRSKVAWICPEGLVGVGVESSGLPDRDGQIVVTVLRGEDTTRGVLNPGANSWQVPAVGGPSRTSLTYIEEGMRHIAVGVDHLVFVLGLLLLAPGLRALLGIVTAFTLGHSVTLGVATLSGVTPASAPTEALIAGSILLLARELVVSRREDRHGRHPAGLAAIFGLAHGFGFSGALTEVGVPAGELAAALFGFNLGVEMGQLLFVGVLSILGFGFGRVSPDRMEALRGALPWGIGALAGCWFLERVLALG